MDAPTNSKQLQSFHRLLVYSVFSMYCIKMLDEQVFMNIINCKLSSMLSVERSNIKLGRMYSGTTAILLPTFHLLHTSYKKARDNVVKDLFLVM